MAVARKRKTSREGRIAAIVADRSTTSSKYLLTNLNRCRAPAGSLSFWTLRRKFVVTTDSAHGLKVYPNLAGSMILTGVDQLWVADITYIRLEEEFVYLAVILDAYSRRVIGWQLDDGLDDTLTLTALRMALRDRGVRPGLVHHSDRGVQYASGD